MSQRTVPRAPTRDGAVLAVPPLREAGTILAANRQRLQRHAVNRSLLGRPWTDLRHQARQSAVDAAVRYLGESAISAIGNIQIDTLLVAGHQPELFHPGVWVKNFALCGLARAHQGTALNLVIDNDTVKTTALHVPAPLTPNPSPPEGGRGEPLAPFAWGRGERFTPLSPGGGEGLGVRGRIDQFHRRSVLFDRWTGEVPYEERTIADRELFASFAARAGELLRGWPYQPMLPVFWDEVLRQSQRTPILGECFAAARRTFERAWGCHNLEVPLSTLCDAEPFAWFACDVLANLPRFHALYNAIVADYRRRHGIRSRSHPVPDLAADGDWLEAPFWCWRAESNNPRRKRLFVRRREDRLELRSDADDWPALPLPELGDASAAVQAWLDLRKRGFKLRSRALTTTLYARLFLADLFIHGIGGGKYDELTDELIRQFYECDPPIYLMLSATRWLPLPHAAVTIEDRRRLLRALREARCNPQRHLDAASDDLRELAARKQEWIERRPRTHAGRRERFRMLRTLTEELRRPLRPHEEQLRRELADCERQLRSNAILQRRDYSFCLFPADSLRPFCTQFLTAPD